VEPPQRGEDDLDAGEHAGGQPDLPADGCEIGAVAITEGDRAARAAAPSFRADSLGLALVGHCLLP